MTSTTKTCRTLHADEAMGLRQVTMLHAEMVATVTATKNEES